MAVDHSLFFSISSTASAKMSEFVTDKLEAEQLTQIES